MAVDGFMTEPKCFVFRFADLEVREREFSVTRAGEPVALEPKAFRVLQFFLHHPNVLVTKDELLDAVWADVSVTENSPARAVAQIRRVLGDDLREPRFIATVTTAGYRFVCPVEALEDGQSLRDGWHAPAQLNRNGLGEESGPARLGPTAAVSAADGVEVRKEAEVGKWNFIERRHAPRRIWMVVAVLACCGIFMGLFTGLSRRTSPVAGNYKFTHLASNLGHKLRFCFESAGALWSPDGRAIVYTKAVSGKNQLFMRYLSAPSDFQMTHEPQQVYPLSWLPDGVHIFFTEQADEIGPDGQKLFSIATVGGEPEFMMSFTGVAAALSWDGKALAIFTKGDRTEYGVQVSDPIGSPPRWYSPLPFSIRGYDNAPGIAFMPDGKAILVTYHDDQYRFHSWLLPYPAGGKAPRSSPFILPEESPYTWSRMPDGRHVVASWTEDQGLPLRLWMWDTESEERVPLTNGAAEDLVPRVAPDGTKLMFAQAVSQIDLTTLSVEDGSATTLIHTGRDEEMASWSKSSGRLVWVSTRNGPYEIWVGEQDGLSRPIVTGADFPPKSLLWFMNPAISPDGTRVIYERAERSGRARLWISSLRGGAPVRLTNVELGAENSGSWSPDGKRFVWMNLMSEGNLLMLVNTSGGATPIQLRQTGGSMTIPEWSPDGSWIIFRDDDGWHLISPDGKSTKSLGKIHTQHLCFSKDGKLLYGIEEGTAKDPHHLALFSLDPATLKFTKIKDLDPKLLPRSDVGPGIRFSVAPDGKSLVYSTYEGQNDLWLLEGLQEPGWLDRFHGVIGKYFARRS